MSVLYVKVSEHTVIVLHFTGGITEKDWVTVINPCLHNTFA